MGIIGIVVKESDLMLSGRVVIVAIAIVVIIMGAMAIVDSLGLRTFQSFLGKNIETIILSYSIQVDYTNLNKTVDGVTFLPTVAQVIMRAPPEYFESGIQVVETDNVTLPKGYTLNYTIGCSIELVGKKLHSASFSFSDIRSREFRTYFQQAVSGDSITANYVIRYVLYYGNSRIDSDEVPISEVLTVV